MKTFVMGDIHGTHRALLQCLQRSSFDREQDRLIQLGDVADGYPETFACVSELLSLKNVIAIRGNHDYWLQNFIKTGFHLQDWTHGGMATIKSYIGKNGAKPVADLNHPVVIQHMNPADIPLQHQFFFQSQRPYFIDENWNCFVHAGFNPLISFNNQSYFDFFYCRDMWNAANENENNFDTNGFNEIYIGHTPTQRSGSEIPVKKANVFNLDTGAGHTGKLTIMDIATKQYWQSDPVASLYPV